MRQMTTMRSKSANVLSVAMFCLSFALSGALTAARGTPSLPQFPPNESPRDWLNYRKIAYGMRAGWGTLVEGAESVAEIHIESIDPPEFNSTDGTYWDGSSSITTEGYTRIHVTVQEVWLGASLPASIDLLVFGDGSARYESSGIPPYAYISGGFTPGDSFVVLLKQAVFPFENEDHTAWTVAADFEGNWRVDGQSAIGADVSRSMRL